MVIILIGTPVPAPDGTQAVQLGMHLEGVDPENAAKMMRQMADQLEAAAKPQSPLYVPPTRIPREVILNPKGDNNNG